MLTSVMSLTNFMTSTQNPAQCDKVLTTRADYYFSQGRYALSAQSYAQSTVAFEEVTLKFVERDERDALREYLLSKLNKLRRGVLTLCFDIKNTTCRHYHYIDTTIHFIKIFFLQDHIQRTMIATWLVEIYLNKINMLEDQTTASAGSDEANNLLAEQKFVEDEFKVFLDEFKVNNNGIINY